MKPFLLILLGVHCVVASLRAGDSVAFTSPDGRFAVRTTDASNQSVREIIEVKTGRALKELDGPFRSIDDPVLWSANSCWAAYANHGGRVADTFVLFWDGADFNEVELPSLPDPEIKFPSARRRGGRVETLHEYASEKPLRWLPSGALVVESTIEVYRLEGGGRRVNYSRRNVFAVGFNARQKPSVLHTVKGKQKIEINP